MINEIAKFKDLEIRIAYVGKEPYFVAKDICDALYISNVSHALSDLDEDEKCKLSAIVSNDTTSEKPSRARKTQELLYVSESGLYGLLLKSKKKEAKAFKKWVRKDVLISISRTGSYSLKARSSNWLQQRQEGIGIRKTETEVIDQFVKYAIEQGASEKGAKMYFATFTKEVYKAIGVEKGVRDKATGLELYQLSLLEMTISNSLMDSMQGKMHYKDAYKLAKSNFIQVAELAGFSTNKKKLLEM